MSAMPARSAYVAGTVHVRANDRAHDVGGYLLLFLTDRVQALYARLQLQSASNCHHSHHSSSLLLPLRSTARMLTTTSRLTIIH